MDNEKDLISENTSEEIEEVNEVEETVEVVQPEIEEPIELPIDEADEEDDNKLGFAADMMGKSKKALKNDTYISYIKSVMKFIGKAYNTNFVTPEEIESDIAQIQRFNGLGICLSPIYMDVIGDMKKRLGAVPASVTALIGYPMGVSSFDGVETDVQECKKSGASKYISVFPTAAISLNEVANLQAKYAKLAKKLKGTLSLAIAPDFPEENLMKLSELISETQINSITLLAEKLDSEALNKFVSFAASVKGSKKLNVFCSLDTCDGVSRLFKRGADTIYTPYFEEIGEELIKQFGVEM